MTAKDLPKRLKRLKDVKVLQKEPLLKHTTIRAGGVSPILIIPKSERALIETLRALGSRRRRVMVIGNGSKLLFPDRGIENIIIKTGSGLESLKIDGLFASAGSGMSVQKLLRILAQKGLGGMEFAAGVPASVGGAAWMNLGAYGKDMSGFVREVRTVSMNGSVKTWKKKKSMKFGYRKSVFQKKNEIITEVTFKLQRAKPKTIKKRIEKYLAARRSSQPLSVPSFGSTFKNPKGFHAARLIEEAGAKGLRIGDAQVSMKHANFIINLGNARASDVISLIKKVRAMVKAKAGVTLAPEINIVKEQRC